MSMAEEMHEITGIPMAFRPRGGRSVIVLPDGSRGVVRQEATIDNTMIKVTADGNHCHRVGDVGIGGTFADLTFVSLHCEGQCVGEFEHLHDRFFQFATRCWFQRFFRFQVGGWAIGNSLDDGFWNSKKPFH